MPMAPRPQLYRRNTQKAQAYPAGCSADATLPAIAAGTLGAEIVRPSIPERLVDTSALARHKRGRLVEGR